MAVSRIAYLLAGAALGAAGAALAKDGKGTDLLQNLVKGGYGMTEKLLASVETIKEDIEDYLAEAKFMQEEKAKTAATAQAEEKPTKKAVTKKAPAKKAAPKKNAPGKTAAKAATVKKAPAKKTTARKSAGRKPAASKAPAKKAAPKRKAE